MTENNLAALDDSLDMSDEDFLKQETALGQEAEAIEIAAVPPPDDRQVEDVEVNTANTDDTDTSDADNTEDGTTNVNDSDDQTNDADGDKQNITDEEIDNSEPVAGDEANEPQENKTDKDDATDEDTSNKDDTDSDNADSAIDYKAGLEKVLAPFKASGSMIQVDTVEDAVNLMRMGADYNKKMRRVKPLLKVGKTLETAGLINDSEKLNLLIDAGNGNKEAIRSLVKQHDVDIDEFNESDDATTYRPNNHAIDEATFNLSEVLDSIRGSDQYDKTSSIITKEWDQKSRAQLFENPHIVGIIHEHVQSGFYDKVNSEIQRLTAIGRVPEGTPNIDVYGAIAKQFTEAEIADTSSISGNEQQTEQNKLKNAERDKKRKAAGGTRKKPPSTKVAMSGEEILQMSDEDFAEASAKGLFKTIK